MLRKRRAWTVAAGLLPLVAGAAADDPAALSGEPEGWNIHGQATYIWQRKPAFSAPYSGPNSLSPERAKSYSFTSTAFMGLRLGPQTEFYFNPEVVQGVPLSRLTGLGGLTNGELQKTAGSNPILYRARLFVRHTWGLGGGQEHVTSEANQLASSYDRRRVTVTVGNLAASDIFEAGRYANDARTQFMNWALLTHGAWDYAADSRGYSWGAAVEYRDGDAWSFRVGRFAQPRESNGLKLDRHIFAHHGDQIEVQHDHAIHGRPGSVRLLAFRNTAVMGGFRDALAFGAANGAVPDVGPVRTRRHKTGAGVALDQELADGIGFFARIARHDGKTETFAFAEIDQSASAGLSIEGNRWGRPRDTLGLALAQNGLSAAHRDFLAAGGTGFFVGDGRLPHYRREGIVEAYYRIGFPMAAAAESAVTLGVQHIRNPAYNADRGPVRVYSARLHAEF